MASSTVQREKVRMKTHVLPFLSAFRPGGEPLVAIAKEGIKRNGIPPLEREKYARKIATSTDINGVFEILKGEKNIDINLILLDAYPKIIDRLVKQLKAAITTDEINPIIVLARCQEAMGRLGEMEKQLGKLRFVFRKEHLLLDKIGGITSKLNEAKAEIAKRMD
ncbi:MAG: hypothetical protein AABX38_03800 [Candidatus Micrarchaeota archaeon]